MMKYEFEQIAGYEVSDKDYNEIIEPMYMATNLDKVEFVKTLDKKRFALKPLKKIEKEMKEIARHLRETCTHYTDWDAKNRLAELAEEYQKRIGQTGFLINEEMRFTCYYPVSIEIIARDYRTAKKIELM